MTKWTLQQQLAIELDNRNIIVSAGAGSGKTAVLTERVINKIRNGVKINQLLILTFTRAAALEMKERIRKALVKEGYSEQLLLIDSSYITTFDSFALAIVKRYHYLLDISKNIEITPSCIIEIQKRKIIDEIFDNIYKNKNQEDLKIIYDFCFKDDNGLKNSIYEISSKMDQLVNKKEYLEHYFDNYLTIINSQINYFDKVVKDKLNNILVLLYELSGFCEGDVLSSVLDVKESLSYYTSVFELKEKLKFELPRKNKECSDGYSELKATIKKYCDELIKELFYNSKEEMIEEVNKTIPLQRFIIKIINELEEKINKYKKENSFFTFYDIAKKAIEVVELNNDVQLELMDEYNEIMIDEYQDTSDIQEKFISLISKNNVYMVGDMKQSIYGFRNANPDLFKSKYNSYKEATIDSINTKIDLLHNFRSRKNVVDCINGIFGKVMDYTFGGVDYLKGHIMNQGNHTYDQLPDNILDNPKMFHLEVLEYGNIENGTTSEKEAFIICNDILNKMKNGYCVFDKNLLEKGENPYRKPQYKDFAILIDKTKDFDLYKKIFEYFNIPLTIYRDESLLEGYNIILICNILKFINKIYLNEFDETFKYLYVSIARSFLFNNYDDEIYLNIKNMNIYQSEIFNISKTIANNIKNLSFKEIISLVINDFSFYEKIHLVGSIDKFIAEVEYLITLAIVINKCNNSFGDFIGFIDDIMKYDLSLTYSYQIGMQDGVKLMTVHKSKGLEFPVIYCSGLGSKFNESEIKSSFLFNQEMGIICPNYQFGIKDTFLKSNYIYNYKYNEISERIRLFYVMLTRAKEKIIFVIDNIENKDSNLPDNLKKFKINSFKKMINLSLDNVVYDLKNLSDNDIEVSDKYKVISKVNFDKLKKENFEIRCNDNVIKYEKIVKQRLSKDSLNIDNVHVKMMKRKGTELHYIFEQLDILNLYNDIDSINNLNYSLNIKKLIEYFMKSEIFENLINPVFFKEYEFLYEKNNSITHGIIDLLIVSENCIRIVDYKLKNINDLEYIKQINGYIDYVKSISNSNVEGYIYSLIDQTIKKI